MEPVPMALGARPDTTVEAAGLTDQEEAAVAVVLAAVLTGTPPPVPQGRRRGPQVRWRRPDREGGVRVGPSWRREGRGLHRA
ncbi:acyl-CoA carboxylase subunit epsilon [Nocardiopsis sp. FR26]|uniref:acyl-CoA carboxylase subunit epsilon n=1 Tax=Nocardiopsis sp. FR26 TaxID=2605987 RepID=UPI00135AC1B2|nr:acyl-CoA carboxylase subunit epsilon [Nocardiopsis sp. FR26]